MKTSWLAASFVLHAAAIGTALGVAAYAAGGPRTPPRVALQVTEASRPAAPPAVAIPEPLVEPAVVEVEAALPEVLLSEPIAAPPVRLFERVTASAPNADAWSRMSIRRVPPRVTAAPAAVPVEPAQPVEPAEPAADVQAQARADNPPPAYPDAERLRGHEGTVRILVHVDETGAVTAAELKVPSPHPGLNREALRAVRGWRFEPARRRGVPTAGTTEVSVVFRLTDRRTGPQVGR